MELRNMKKNLSPETRRLIRLALKEDVGSGDLTANTLIPAQASGSAVILARAAGVWAGTEAVREVFRAADPSLRLSFNIKEGGAYAKNQTVLEIKGNIRNVLKAERTALNF